ncbi:hypothetical protein SCHPADRAFT_906362 [Schizopora paradoxa]|uniref:Granulins domain-containing protein n=1 Tax=Schizopora paradoxa TaxID=27342 RepID=A0A0H2RNL6_9AGAM|nr:hypothetical protein SCHPADRAFT_906362 [Schizopora paradoxa]
MQLLAPLILTLSTIASAYASPDPNTNNLEVRYAYLRPHQVPRENSLSGLLRRQTCAQLGLDACIDPVGFCCPVTSTCCTGVGAGGCCDFGEFCDVVDGIPGCCPNGQICNLPPTGSASNIIPSLTPSVVVPSLSGTGGGNPTVISTPKNTLTNTGTGTASAGGGGAIPTGTVSLLPPIISVSSTARAGGSSAGGASPSSQTTGGSGSGNPFAASAATSTIASLGFVTLCGSAVLSLLAAALI